ncbi:nucleotidyltransferase domain-containing protein [Methylomonas rivi]|uniref:Nucleotidyltransferase domain-containing protein n=1 Tax=Methylomonas rivi TaxID=2952226 RepID=A0ABT1U7N5_9GAMM|nr:nucleotidyltransferase domain-containing protein [Methylomonas sp. WSC-6]MBS4050387.1 nucleotidyltransferase domain-containing protein [Methylomonas sp.]MCQ8129424.1 nucleotidyltransferase domain-containing protein [Methylomonas sp. WSC-6]
MPHEALAERSGLSVGNIAALQRVFANHPEVEQALLYGSRAKGTARKGSDIDLTLLGDKLDYRLLTRIETEIDDLLLPYTVDLSLFQQIDNPDLIDHIRRVGLIFYPSQ